MRALVSRLAHPFVLRLALPLVILSEAKDLCGPYDVAS
jgi:hypothetical protein